MSELTPQERLAWIATAHARSDNRLSGRISCEECEDPWPCPTYVVATAADIPGDPFAARDVDLYRRAGMES